MGSWVVIVDSDSKVCANIFVVSGALTCECLGSVTKDLKNDNIVDCVLVDGDVG